MIALDIKSIIKISFICFLFIICQCSVPNEQIFSITVDKISEFKLEEDTLKLSTLLRVKSVEDSILIGLDENMTMIEFNIMGKILKKVSEFGNAPNNIFYGCAFAANERYIVFAQSTGAVKWLTRNGEYLRESFLKVTPATIVCGELFILHNGDVIFSALNEPTAPKYYPAVIFDSIGNIKTKIGTYPDEYRDFFLEHLQTFDVNNSNDIALSFAYSPSLWIGNVLTNKGELCAFPKQQKLFISSSKPKREDKNQSIVNVDIPKKKAIEMALTERLNYRTLFLNDSIILRANSIETKESLKSGNFVSKNHFLQIFSKSGKYLGEISIHGVLHCKIKNILLIEESDEPDNRRFGLYKINIEPVK